MIDKIMMGEILKPLEKRFNKRLTADQAEIYYNRLRYFDRLSVEKAVDDCIDNLKMFPTPGEIKEAQRKYRQEISDNAGCAHCLHGWVLYEKPDGHQVTSRCAYCNEVSLQPHPLVIERDGAVYYANLEGKHEGKDAFFPEFNRIEMAGRSVMRPRA